MAENTLTNLIPDLYAGLDTISRELVGYIPAVARDSTAERASVGEDVRYPIAPSATSANIAPAMAIPDPTGQTVGSGTITITKAKMAEFGFLGEAQLGLENGAGFGTVQGDMVAQAIRVLVNEVETDLAVAAVAGSSRAVPIAATTPFATDTSGISNVRKVLVDNGSPTSDMQLVLGTTAGAALRTLAGLHDTRDWSTVPMAEQGVLMNAHGVSIRETGQEQTIVLVAKTGTIDTNTSEPIGETDIAIDAASASTFDAVPGSVVTFAGDLNKYVVTTTIDLNASSSATLKIAEPGLLKALVGAEVVSIEATHVADIAFYRRAIQLVTRQPALPKEGDLAMDRIALTDPRSGLTFDFAIYGGYRKVRYEVALAWGVKVTQTRHVAMLMG